MIIHPNGMWTEAGAVLSSHVQVIILGKYQIWILCSIKTHVFMLQTNWRQTSEQQLLVLGNHIVKILAVCQL